MTAVGETATRRHQRKRGRSRATITSVLGELMLTAGVIVLLFVAWQMWIGDIIIGAQNNERGAAYSEQWAAAPVPELPAHSTDTEATGVWEPPILPHPAEGQVFATMLVPRFGADYAVPIAGGTSREITLDHIGIGLYEQSRMPGEVGNFSLAGHRTTWGKPFNQLDKLRLNDAIVVETPEGWYTYRFRTLEYVTPTQVEVLADVPAMPAMETGERYITLTACSPLYSLEERIVAYGLFEGFQPRAEGAPTSLTEGGL